MSFGGNSPTKPHGMVPGDYRQSLGALVEGVLGVRLGDEDLTLTDRTFRCEDCGQALERDLNAALNLAQCAKLAGSSSERQNACGEESAGWGLVAQVHLSPLKQEPNTFAASA